MKRTISVHMGERSRLVGYLHYNQEGARERASFEYDPSWLGETERFAIEPLLRLVPGPQFHKRPNKHDSIFHGAIADTGPDGWGKRVIYRDHMKRRAAAVAAGEESNSLPLGELDYLLAVDDKLRVGALRFRDETGVFQRASEEGQWQTPPTVSLAQLIASSRAVEMGQETLADLEYLRGRGTSLGGLRPKCSIVEPDGHLAIGKFPSVGDLRPVTKGEVLALRLAKEAGIQAAEAALVYSDGVPVSMVRRFDRVGELRVPYISAATMLGAPSSDPEPHTYTEIVDAIRIHGANPTQEFEELWRRIAFSILITNTDDHLHNHGFLHHGDGRWVLSPAFDVNPFPERLRELKTWISEESGPTASLEPLMDAGRYFQIDVGRAREIVGEVDRAVAQWRTHGLRIGMSEGELDQFADAFEHVEREAARRIATR
jgi:serine/threonine-protein kinase HipA